MNDVVCGSIERKGDAQFSIAINRHNARGMIHRIAGGRVAGYNLSKDAISLAGLRQFVFRPAQANKIRVETFHVLLNDLGRVAVGIHSDKYDLNPRRIFRF